jgi:ketosteroid isomerase-like protein
MSANSELVRRSYAAFIERGELRPDRFTDDFVWDMSTFTGWPEKSQYRGVEGAVEFLENWTGSFDDWSLELRDVIDAGGDVVLICHQRGRAKSTGAEVEMDFAQVWTVRHGKLAYQRMYADVGEALASVGAERRRTPRPPE